MLYWEEHGGRFREALLYINYCARRSFGEEKSMRHAPDKSLHKFVIVMVVVLILLAVLMAYSYGYIGNAPTSNSVPPVQTPNAHNASWIAYHGGMLRNGYDPANVLAIQPSLNWKSPQLDGAVYAEPLVLNSTVFVATENDSVYALNVTDGGVLWRTHLGSPMPGSLLPCGDINPSGITGTPVIDTSSSRIYVVAFLQPGVHRLYSLDALTGKVLWNVTADPPGSNPIVEQQRGALALFDGMVYVPYGGLDGDCGDYHGYIVGISTSGNGSLISFQATQSREGGIWAPSGIVVYDGMLFVATGNDASTTNFDYGNSVLELTPSLRLVSWFAPTNWVSLNLNDQDLGSTSPTVIEPDLIFQVGKQGVGYLLNETDLGGVGGQVFEANVCEGAFGGTAYLYPYIYVSCSNGLFALFVQEGSTPSFTVVWYEGGNSGPPIISGGYVWAVNLASGQLTAYDPSSGTIHYEIQLSGPVHFETPAAGDGMIFAVSGNEVISVTE